MEHMYDVPWTAQCCSPGVCAVAAPWLVEEGLLFSVAGSSARRRLPSIVDMVY